MSHPGPQKCPNCGELAADEDGCSNCDFDPSEYDEPMQTCSSCGAKVQVLFNNDRCLPCHEASVGDFSDEEKYHMED